MNNKLDPTPILQTGMGFWSSKVLLSAVGLQLFTVMGTKKLSGDEIGKALKLHPRGIWDFLDSLVAMNFLERQGEGKGGLYSNTELTAAFLDKNGPEYIGGILEMAETRLYPYWADLTEGLRTGLPQSESKHQKKPIFEILYQDPERLEEFMQAMTGISAGNFQVFAEKFDFSPYSTFCDVGGATGQLSIKVAKRHPHIKCTSFDMPVVEPIAKRTIAAAGLSDRVSTASGDFFKSPLPKADIITMGMILHDWNLPNKMKLIQAAYEALPQGGVFIAIENLIDNERRKNVFGLLMSLNMLIEFGEAFDFTGADFGGWCKEVGFKKIEVMPLCGPASAAIAYK